MFDSLVNLIDTVLSYIWVAVLCIVCIIGFLVMATFYTLVIVMFGGAFFGIDYRVIFGIVSVLLLFFLWAHVSSQSQVTDFPPLPPPPEPPPPSPVRGRVLITVTEARQTAIAMLRRQRSQ